MLVHFRTGLALAVLACSTNSAIAAKKKTTSPVKKTVAKSKAVKIAKATKVSARPSNRLQTVPTPERYKEIQEALISKGYLSPAQANGQWNDASIDALKRFQADQKIDASGRINALSLIALGLGPKREVAQAPENSSRIPPANATAMGRALLPANP